MARVPLKFCINLSYEVDDSGYESTDPKEMVLEDVEYLKQDPRALIEVMFHPLPEDKVAITFTPVFD